MKITDACVYPYPSGDSSLRRLALEARTLGFDSIVAMEAPAGELDGVMVLTGILIPETAARDVSSRVKRAKDANAVVSVQAGHNGFNRAVIGMRGVHILRGIQSAEKTAFDHVAAKMAADNGVAIDIDLSPLVSGQGATRQRAIHRYLDLIMLQHRFEFPITISSHARSVLDMRGVREITGLCSLFGMEVADVKNALAAVYRITKPDDSPVKVIQ